MLAKIDIKIKFCSSTTESEYTHTQYTIHIVVKRCLVELERRARIVKVSYQFHVSISMHSRARDPNRELLLLLLLPLDYVSGVYIMLTTFVQQLPSE